VDYTLCDSLGHLTANEQKFFGRLYWCTSFPTMRMNTQTDQPINSMVQSPS